MTYPQDPYGHNPFSYDPLGRVPYEEPPLQPPIFAAPPPPPYRPSVNPFATLSLVFAFVFAPAGAILGHLGLAQIRRTGELGRNRALVGLALSYAFITLTVVALIAWATLAATTSNQTAAPTATTTTSAPPAPTVAPQAAPTLLPGVGDLKNITGDENLEAGQAWDHPSRSNSEGTIDRPECWGSIGPGNPDAYNLGAMSGYHAQEFTDTRSLLSSVEVIQAVAVFHEVPVAQSQLAKVLAGWHQCGGSTVNVTIPSGQTIPFDLTAPADAGNGVTTMDVAHKGIQVHSVRAIAAKANVFIDLYLSYSGKADGERPRQAAVGIANYILGKIPG
ncbi:MAG: sensor domain-containing protein [Mycobacterium sp.]